MKKTKMFKSRNQMILYFFLYIVFIALFVVIGKSSYKVEKSSDAEEFSNIYKEVELDNGFVFGNANKVLEIIDGRSGVILMGFPANKWMNDYARILNDVRKELGIEEIIYYDFLQDRHDSNGTYETIVNRLAAYAPVDDLGIQNLAAPTVLVVKNGEILAYFDETSILHGNVTPDIYYNENQTALTYQMFKTALESYIGTDDYEG